MSLASNVVGSVAATLANQPAPVVLGSMVLFGAEAPSRVTIGGRQLAAIHKLPGGARIIDAMGPDDNAIVWQGVFIGPAAASRVRMVDALRTSGEICTFSFGDYLFQIIVVDFSYSYQSRGAVISYSIRAEKIQDITDPLSVSAWQGAISDCATAVQFLTNTRASIAAYGGLTGGLSGGTSLLLSGVLSTVGGVSGTADSTLQAQALLSSTAAIQTAIAKVSIGNLATGASSLSVSSGTQLAAVVQQAGALAGLVGAGGYINRASVGVAASNALPATVGIHS